jgi:hypothetical protein
MTLEWPGGNEFDIISEDLEPLREVYGPGELVLPHALEALQEGPLSQGDLFAAAWEFHGTAPVRQRGDAPTGQRVVIRGVTIVRTISPESSVCHRYIDWADLWAQVGQSAGRAEFFETQELLNMNFETINEDGEVVPDG